MAAPPRPTICPHCGKLEMIRPDRTYCSISCANKANALKARVQKSWTRAVVVGDLHIPFHDQRAVSLSCLFITSIKPDIVILNGDILDCYDISAFSKDPQRNAALAQEFSEAREFLGMLRTIVPHAEIRYVYGNHEHRFHKFIIQNARELIGIRGSTLAEQLDLVPLNIQPIESHGDRFTDNYTKLGELLVGHFDKVCKHSGYTAKALLDDYGSSLIQSHVHSVGSSNRTLEGGEIMAWEGGCLCDLNPVYCKPKKWAHAFCVVDLEDDGKFFHVNQVVMHNYQFFYGGELWRG